jgi:hypothetical protein
VPDHLVGQRAFADSQLGRKASSWWAGLWPFLIVVAYFLVGLWGHHINTAMNRAAAERERPPQSN